MNRNTALVATVALWLLFLLGVLYIEEQRLRQQSIDMQESRPYAVIGE